MFSKNATFSQIQCIYSASEHVTGKNYWRERYDCHSRWEGESRREAEQFSIDMGRLDQTLAPARSVQVVQEITVYCSFRNILDASFTYEHCLL